MTLLIIPAAQLVTTYAFHWWIGRCLERLPALAPAMSGAERLLPVVFAVVLLTLELCLLLIAFGVLVPVGTVMLIELLLIPMCSSALWREDSGNIGKTKETLNPKRAVPGGQLFLCRFSSIQLFR